MAMQRRQERETVNLFEPEIKKFEEKVSPKTLEKVRALTREFSATYINNRRSTPINELQNAFAAMYSEHGKGKVVPVKPNFP